MLYSGNAQATRRSCPRRLNEFITALIGESAARGEARDDIPAAELAAYCLHALTASAAMPSEAAVDRLVGVTLAGLRRAS